MLETPIRLGPRRGDFLPQLKPVYFGKQRLNNVSAYTNSSTPVAVLVVKSPGMFPL